MLMIARIFLATLLAVGLSFGTASAQSFSSLPAATVPLGGSESVPMDQGSGCSGHTSPCSTVQAPSARVGLPITASAGCAAAIGSPFSYQECFDTSGSLPILRQWFHGSWNPVYTIDTSTGIVTPPVGGGTATIASATTTDLCSSPQAAITVSGTTTITSFGSTCQKGVIKFLTFSGSLTLTYNATSLILPGAGNITTEAGDTAIAQPTGSGNWIVLFYQPSTGYAALNSPAFTGTPTAPTASPGTNTTQLATTAFVANAVSGLAPLASPAFTGTPTAPTPTSGDDSTKIATTAYVYGTFAPLASPALTGTPTAPTASPGTNTTQIATTAFVATADSGFAPLASPAFTGTPTAPTASSGTSTTQLATTAFVQGLLASPTFTGTVIFPDGSTWNSSGIATTGHPVPIGALATIAADNILANATGSTAAPTAVSPATLGSILCQTGVTVLTTGSGTFTTPTCNGVSASWLRVRMVGAGGGSGGNGSGAGNGGNGGATTFGSLTANGGTGTVANGSAGQAGGTAVGGDINITGGDGSPAPYTGVTIFFSGGQGGSSAFGGAGAAGANDGAASPDPGKTNSGGGGGGPSSNGGAGYGVGGGGAGGYLEKLISFPGASYSYAIGIGGVAGTPGSSASGGAAGGSGIIIIQYGWQ